MNVCYLETIPPCHTPDIAGSSCHTFFCTENDIEASRCDIVDAEVVFWFLFSLHCNGVPDFQFRFSMLHGVVNLLKHQPTRMKPYSNSSTFKFEY